MRDFGDIGDAYTQGRYYSSTLYKETVGGVASIARWVDILTMRGIPQRCFYAGEPLAAAELENRYAIFPGWNVAPKKKFLSDVIGFYGQVSSAGATAIICDVLLFYPYIEMDVLSVQHMDNTVTLPRYTDGEGVMAYAVLQVTSGSATFTFDYINQDGVQKTSPTITLQTGVAGHIVNASSISPWLTLADGDTGIRSIVSVQAFGPATSTIAIVLAKPLTTTRILHGICHKSAISSGMAFPRVYDGAKIGVIIRPAASSSAGDEAMELSFIWEE